MNRTKINKKARNEIAKICELNDWRWCIAKLNNRCQVNAHSPHHRHKRRWYYDKPDKLLWDVKQWIEVCNSCHAILEKDPKLTEQIFQDRRIGSDYDTI